MRPHELRLPHPAGPGQRQTDERHVFPRWKAGFRLVRARKRRKAHAGPAVAELGNGHGAGHRGARNDILIVGGEDNLALQELSFMTPEILERVNAFMDAPVFDRVELRLVMGDRPLDQMPDIQPSTRVRPAPPRPRQLGAHLEEMNPDSPVARCYAAYLRMHGVPTERKS